MDKFTKAIHARGWTVWDACEHWGIEYTNFRRRCRRVDSGQARNELEVNQLLDMCNGLDMKEGEE